jgi:hypothetical protein
MTPAYKSLTKNQSFYNANLSCIKEEILKAQEVSK